jgi:hypothetical protein
MLAGSRVQLLNGLVAPSQDQGVEGRSLREAGGVAGQPRGVNDQGAAGAADSAIGAGRLRANAHGGAFVAATAAAA